MPQPHSLQGADVAALHTRLAATPHRPTTCRPAAAATWAQRFWHNCTPQGRLMPSKCGWHQVTTVTAAGAEVVVTSVGCAAVLVLLLLLDVTSLAESGSVSRPACPCRPHTWASTHCMCSNNPWTTCMAPATPIAANQQPPPVCPNKADCAKRADACSSRQEA